MDNTKSQNRWSTLRARYHTALAARDAAIVPDADRNGPGTESVTISGWYECPTVSGRDAWVRYDWINGRCQQGRATYDLAAEAALREAELDYEPWNAAERIREGYEAA